LHDILQKRLTTVRKSLAEESDLARVMQTFERQCCKDELLKCSIERADDVRVEAAMRVVLSAAFPGQEPVVYMPNCVVQRAGFHQGLFTLAKGVVGYFYFEATDQGLAYAISAEVRGVDYFRFSILAEPTTAPGGEA
jgi:hypothetical protein